MNLASALRPSSTIESLAIQAHLSLTMLRYTLWCKATTDLPFCGVVGVINVYNLWLELQEHLLLPRRHDPKYERIFALTTEDDLRVFLSKPVTRPSLSSGSGTFADRTYIQVAVIASKVHSTPYLRHALRSEQ